METIELICGIGNVKLLMRIYKHMTTVNIKSIILAFGLAIGLPTAMYSQNEKTDSIIKNDNTDTFYQLKKLDTMRKFDVETFNKNKKKIYTWYQFETDKAIINESEDHSYYSEQIDYKNNHFEDIYIL